MVVAANGLLLAWHAARRWTARRAVLERAQLRQQPTDGCRVGLGSREHRAPQKHLATNRPSL